MNHEHRKQILWFGNEPPASLVTELANRDLQLTAATNLTLSELSPLARGLVIEFRGDKDGFVQTLTSVRTLSLMHGLRIGLVQGLSIADSAAYYGAAKAGIGDSKYSDRISSFYQKWAALAEWFARYDPGPSYSSELVIEGLAEISTEKATLLKRAFSGYAKVHIESISGGLSGSEVYSVYPIREDRVVVGRPYLAKIDELDRIRAEKANIESFVVNAVPFNHRPNLNVQRYAEGETLGILVEDFIDRAIPLKSALKSGNASVFIASLFEGALCGWRLCALPAEVRLQQYFKEQKILRQSEALSEAADMAKRYDGFLNEKRVITTLDKLNPIVCHQCIVHGDLHAGNVFVAAASADVIIIDFYKTQIGPAVTDAAALEVSLAFRFNDSFDEEFLRLVYRYPLPVPALDVRYRRQEWRWDAIRAIRLFGGSQGSEKRAYIVAIICRLIQFASYPVNPLDRRALALYLADQLAGNLH